MFKNKSLIKPFG